ncbi:MAG: helix-turn-helix transcriptional regulator [Thaumarchaeota archaeon]|nr:helix-turn-helix transcriptional regulator [Nitrososphaerota archaeon]
MRAKPTSTITYRIFSLLIKHEKMRFTDFENKLGISKPVLSDYLAILTEDGAINFIKKGREKHYVLNKKFLENNDRKIEKFSLFFNDRLSNTTSLNKYETTNEIFKAVENMTAPYFLFALVKGMKTGQNWFRGFNSEELAKTVLDVLISNLFSKDVFQTEFSLLISRYDFDEVFKKVNKMIKANHKTKLKLEHMYSDLSSRYADVIDLLEKDSK